MGEKIILFILLFCMAAGIIMGPFLWGNYSNKEKQMEPIEEKTTVKTTEETTVLASEIRVLLSGSTLGKYEHKKIRITSDQDYYVNSTEKTEKKKAGSITEFVANAGKKGDVITCTGTGKMQVLSIKRSYGKPSYRGKLEIRYGKSSMTLINELLLEEYLYAVLPSEMPVSYGNEALKVQAVCARSFAFNQIKNQKFKKYHADVDDSVASQVYNNTSECKESIQAVKETSGLVAAYQNKVISAYFFSTSWGHTADSHDVWIQKGTSPVYLRGKLQTEAGNVLDLSNEKALKQFLNGNEETYDSKFPWYRWKVTIPYSALSQKSIGKVQNVKVTKRGKSGVAKELRITGSSGVRVIEGEYKIRTYLSPKGYPITKQDGTKGNMNLLPSGCFYLEQKGEKLIITGGGYGHGVGMSQNGAKALAESGKSYKEILQHYYPGVEIKDLSRCE
jgi:stage II sporulation protein D